MNARDVIDTMLWAVSFGASRRDVHEAVDALVADAQRVLAAATRSAKYGVDPASSVQPARGE